MNNTKNSMLITYYHCKDPIKHYSKISNNAMRNRLSAIHGINIERRWCFEANKDLMKDGYIVKRKRYDRNATYPYGQRSSLVAFTLKGALYLYSKGIKGALKLIESIKAWMKGNDNRFPLPELEAERLTRQEIADNRGRLKALVETLA